MSKKSRTLSFGKIYLVLIKIIRLVIATGKSLEATETEATETEHFLPDTEPFYITFGKPNIIKFKATIPCSIIFGSSSLSI